MNQDAKDAVGIIVSMATITARAKVAEAECDHLKEERDYLRKRVKELETMLEEQGLR